MDSKLLIGAIVFFILGVSSSDFTSHSLNDDQENDIEQFVTLLASDSQLSAEEKSAFVTFKAKVVASQDQLPSEESYDYWFLLRFLSAKNFNVEEAYEALAEHMAWRQEDDINNILEEDWSDMEKRFPYTKLLMTSEKLNDGVALWWPLGDWKVRNLQLTWTGQPGEELIKFFRYQSYKMMEDASRTARVLVLTEKLAGKDISSKFHIIVDMKDGSYIDGDTSALVALVETSAQYYKEAVDHFIFINIRNVPTFFCTWSSEGRLTCPKESSTSGEKFFTSLTRLPAGII